MILSLDIGTSKLCALVWDEEAQSVAAVRSTANDATVEGLELGRHEQNPARVVARVHALILDVLSDPAVDRSAITAVAITGQVHGAMLVSESGKPLTNFVTWRDQRTAEFVAEANGADADGGARCGGPLCTGYGGLLLSAWVRERAIPSGVKAMSLLDFVSFSLCGEIATDTTHAASWGLLNLQTDEWDDRRIELLAIPREVLPVLKPSCSLLGPLTAECAHMFELSPAVRVLAPLGDNQASVAAVAGIEPGSCVINLGTGGQISLVCSDFAVCDGLETRPMPFGGFLQVGASLCGGEAYAILARFYRDVVREIGGVEVAMTDVYEHMSKAAECAESDAGGVVADTRFGGTRRDATLRGAITGLGVANLSPGNLVQAIASGMVQELAAMISRPGLPAVRKLLASGNGVRKNPLVRDAIERAFGLVCVLSQQEEEAAVGAARLAAVELNSSGWNG